MTDKSPLTLQIDAEGPVKTVRCSGQLTSKVSEYLREQVKPLIPGSEKVVLDLTDLTFMDSMGLGTIVGLYVSAKAAGSQLRVINLSKRIYDLFSVTNLLTMFEAAGEIDARIP
jgi:anti-sigma B factor antagonist